MQTEASSVLPAIQNDDIDRLRLLLDDDPTLARKPVETAEGHTTTLLHTAIPGDGDRLRPNQLDIIEALLRAGADPNAKGYGANNGVCSPLTFAAWGGSESVIQLLLDAGADHVRDAEIPILAAARHGHRKAIELLVAAGAPHKLQHLLMGGATELALRELAADPNLARRRCSDNVWPLHHAVTGDRVVLEALVAAGANLDATDDRGRTALHLAIEYGSTDAVSWLLEKGARVDLWAAAGLGEAETVARLLECNRESDGGLQADGLSPLFYAAWAGSTECVKLLLDAGAPLDNPVERVWACLTPLHAAIQRGHRSVIALLVDAGANLNGHRASQDAYWPTPLHAAARWCGMDVFAQLLEAGADPNGGESVEGGMDTGPLSWVGASNNWPEFELLLSHGLDARLARHQFTIHALAAQGRGEMIRALIERGANSKIRDSKNRSAADIARLGQHWELAHYLDSCAGPCLPGA